MVVRNVLAGLLGFLALVGGPAQAEWIEATSRHFILYANTSEANLRRQAIALERMDGGLRRFMAFKETEAIAANRVTVFFVGEDEIRALCKCSNVGGFYMSRVSGSVAFAARTGFDAAGVDGGRTILFHEYAHHFLLGSYELAFPAWFVEGFAEFASTARIAPDRVTIGAAANHRAWGLLSGERMTVEAMFDPAIWRRLKGDQFDVFYGRGWLLTHYLMFDPERRKQFGRYVSLLNAGTPSVAAAREAFGDLKTLDRNVAAYLGRSTLPALVMKMAGEAEPMVTVRRLGAGEAALIRLRMESTRGVDDKTGPALYRKAAPIAARFPDDVIAQGWFAEMAYDAKQDSASEAAADRAIARDPKAVQALLYKARVKLRELAANDKADAAAWTAARKPILIANRLDPDDAEPLWLFWQSFAMEGREPSVSAMQGLYRAQELVPQDQGVRFAAALARIKAKDGDEAKRLLRILAYDPHATADNAATRMLAALDAGKAGDAVIAAAAEPVTAVNSALK